LTLARLVAHRNTNASNNSDYKQLFPWKYSHLSLFTLGIVDILCLVGAFGAWTSCWFAKRDLKLHYDGVIDIEKADVQKREAEKVVAAV
jgi:hypothetical protein